MTVEAVGTSGVLPPAVGAFYARTSALSGDVVAQVARLWAGIDYRDVVGSWNAIAEQLLTVVSAGQLAAAGGAEAYLASCLASLGIDATAFGTIAASGFAGQAADGRSLLGELYSPVVKVKQATFLGLGETTARAAGLAALTTIVSTTIEDAARQAAGVGMAVRPGVTGYVRAVTPGACPRCLILAGRFYRWSSGFDRHPRCGCKNVPANEDVSGDLVSDPDEYLRGLSPGERAKILGPVKAQAFDDGADLNQLVNARRGGATSTTVLYGQRVEVTREGTTARGMYGRMQQDLERVGGSRYASSRAPRLTPESIYQIAENRAEARNLLARYGYITE